ncbi:exodeoxyribonuclease VII large subunit [Helicobacter turcicus]|uniref:Exodeoxyribonuclease 7 large subunit n=1 Tax=Helicobacter turcicus TaxID=2867412 RepID=A0ABS7JLR6_9HELI|nr:exodeoxyribonuclease VII large subunit [Helicobacter turcicus]MBX7490339.1 exodeoxyribonuclease VII large subunit [Helicobacter turcicus]MBX7545082.1 exodeoxyribonuclease VII large subunit [Helicobacter turcicus]
MQTLSVTELNTQIKCLIEATFVQVSVSGEVSNFTHHSSGHLYFTLKDRDSSLKCVMFRGNANKLKFKIEEGMELTLEGVISVYVPRGEYQLNCTNAYPNGVGALLLAYEQLKEEYERKGYFADKKPLPKFPKKVALLTSSTGAVLHDMLSVAKKRWNLARFVLLNTLVQGDGAKESIAENIKIADALGVDCIIIARGGGSFEDLWAFNEPLVIEAIHTAKTPIVSAVGHEPDVVLSDFVADLRAPTPSAAIELLLPDQNEWLMRLDTLQGDLDKFLIRILQTKTLKLQGLREQLNQNSFLNKIIQLQMHCKQQAVFLMQKMEHKLALSCLMFQAPSVQIYLKMEQKLAQFQSKLESLKAQMESKNPKNQKEGCVCVLSQGKKIKKLADLNLDSVIELQDKSALIKAQVKEVETLNNV